VRAEPVSLAAALAKRVDPGPDSWRGGWLEAAGSAAEAIGAELASLAQPTEPGIHSALGRLYGDGDLVYTASSMPIRDQEAFLPAGPARVAFLCNRGANGIDGLISSGIGAAAASGRPTWIVTGDLGLYHDMNGLAALRDAHPPVRIVVINNDGGGIFEFLPQAEQTDREEFEAILGTPLGLDVGAVAAVHRIPYARIERLDELWVAPSEGTCMLEVPVDRRANVEIHRRVTVRVSEALGSRRDA
jgi:2-succinyl-5-enolpyruvyl-6-hydroxy-3-cyclohexene-1-carboxylate synthase